MAEFKLARERWEQFWPEAEPLARAHWTEVDGGVEPLRSYAPDAQMMEHMAEANYLHLYTARIEKILVGYCTWNVVMDVESMGLLVAQQGAWYVQPGLTKPVGRELFLFSLRQLKLVGVQCCYPHHRVQGRGAKLGRWFERLGAKHIQQNYSLWLGEPNGKH